YVSNPYSLGGNEIRGIAWGLRTLADAAAWLPDNEALKTYFTEKVQHNLDYLDDYAAAHVTPLGTYFDTLDPTLNVWTIFRQWQNDYVAWAIDRARQQGFTGGLNMRNKLAQCTLRLFTSGPAYPMVDGAPSELAIVTVRNGLPFYYTRIGDVYTASNSFATALPSYWAWPSFQGY